MPRAAVAGKLKTNGKRPAVSSGPPAAAPKPAARTASADSAKRQLLNALRAVARGDFTVKLPASWDGIDGEIAAAFNEVVGSNARVLREIERVSNVVGLDGRLGQRAEFHAPGGYGEKLRAVNRLI